MGVSEPGPRQAVHTRGEFHGEQELRPRRQAGLGRLRSRRQRHSLRQRRAPLAGDHHRLQAGSLTALRSRISSVTSLSQGTGNVIGAFAASGSAVLRGAGGCDLTYSYHPTMSAPFAAADGIVYRPDWLYLEMEEQATARSP